MNSCDLELPQNLPLRWKTQSEAPFTTICDCDKKWETLDASGPYGAGTIGTQPVGATGHLLYDDLQGF
jgi:hypothetical protein